MRVEKEPEKEKPKPFVPAQPMQKIVILIALVIASTALFWLAWHNALSKGIQWEVSTQNIVVVVTTLLAFCLMFSLLAMAEVLIHKRWMLLAMAVIAAGTVFIFFKPTLWSVFGFILTSLSFYYWRQKVRSDEKTRVKFVPTKIIDSGLRASVTLLLLAASLIYYSNLTASDDSSTQLQQNLADISTNVVEKVLEGYYKDYDPEMTLDAFIEEFGFGSVTQVEVTETGYEEIDAALTEGLEGAQEEAVSQARNDLLESFDIEAEGTETMHTVVGRVVTKNLNDLTESWLDFIPAIMALSLFFILNFFTFIYRELIKSMTFLTYIILKWLKFIRIEKTQIEAEKITL